ncbi:MAG: deoxyribose-phosphate aldolase [Sphaerochaetaceae bacterium]|nr:deoxyribose-phosphate aldolase [Sphaerochaetaceae bacterium]
MRPNRKAKEMSVRELASYIDQSVLKPEFTQDEIRRYIQEGVDFGCATVCVNPSSLDIAAELTTGSDTKVCVVCDFPFGLSTTESKVLQAGSYCRRGDVHELDIVANYGWVRSGMWSEVEADLRAVTEVCHGHGVVVKAILETDALTMEQIAQATETAVRTGVDFVKTSTGFYTGGPVNGATPEIVKLMLDVSRGRCKVKGSGCIRTREHFLRLIDMGIDRMGVGYKSTPVVLGIRK